MSFSDETETLLNTATAGAINPVTSAWADGARDGLAIAAQLTDLTLLDVKAWLTLTCDQMTDIERGAILPGIVAHTLECLAQHLRLTAFQIVPPPVPAVTGATPDEM